MERRLSALKKLNVDGPTKSAMQEIICRPMMSSEDEEIEDDQKCFIVRKPSWRAEGVTACFQQLDQLYRENQSNHSRFRSLRRKVGPASDREEPKWSEKMRKAIEYFNE